MWGPDAGILARTFFPITGKDPHDVLTKAPRMAPFIYFFCTVAAFNGHLCKSEASVEKNVWWRSLVMHHIFTDIKVSTVNLSSPEITPAGLKSLDSLHALYSVRCPCSYSISLIYHSISEILNLVESMWWKKLLETNKMCLWYYEICKKERPAFTPTRWKQFQLNLHLRGWLVIAFVIVLLQVQMTSVQRLS